MRPGTDPTPRCRSTGARAGGQFAEAHGVHAASGVAAHLRGRSSGSQSGMMMSGMRRPAAGRSPASRLNVSWRAWASDSGGRLIPLIIIPLWDPELAAARCAAATPLAACTACAFSELPTRLGLPSIYSGEWIRSWPHATRRTPSSICTSGRRRCFRPIAGRAGCRQRDTMFNNAMISMTGLAVSPGSLAVPQSTLGLLRGDRSAGSRSLLERI